MQQFYAGNVQIEAWSESSYNHLKNFSQEDDHGEMQHKITSYAPLRNVLIQITLMYSNSPPPSDTPAAK